ncbi:MAG: hypothetical protein NTU44_16215 [Bacteroidetes bacterium]|nr:hypothetical protein [Bacteroidota bacterium]
MEIYLRLKVNIEIETITSIDPVTEKTLLSFRITLQVSSTNPVSPREGYLRILTTRNKYGMPVTRLILYDRWRERLYPVMRDH